MSIIRYIGTVRLACVSIFLSLLWDSDYIGVIFSKSRGIWPDFDINWELHQQLANFNFFKWWIGSLHFQDFEEITSFWYISTSDSSLAPCHIWLLHLVQGYTANLYCPLQESLRFPAPPWALESTRNPTSLYNSMPIMAEICRYYICGRYSVVQLCSGFLHHNVKK